MKTRIKVAIRMRPLLEQEQEQGATAQTVQLDEENNLVRLNNDKLKLAKEYKFDRALGPNCTQERVFEACNIPRMIDNVVEGYHATIFAYGQTGAGKTYTMEGYYYTSPRDKSNPKPIIEKSEKWGIIPRSIDYLFDKISVEAEKTRRKYTVYCSFLQIYNERIYDLLNPAHFIEGAPGAAGLRLRYRNDNFSVDNLYTFECKNKQDVYDLFHFGLNNRVVATHRLNHASSRSHSLLTLAVESVDMQSPVHPKSLLLLRTIMFSANSSWCPPPLFFSYSTAFST